jgi:hypothetical protein
MKSSSLSRRHVAARTSRHQRAQLLADFEKSGLSAAAFARQQGLKYTTFFGWRGQQAKPSPGFVQVVLPEPSPAAELVLELGPIARVRLSSPGQILLAARLLQTLHAPSPC